MVKTNRIFDDSSTWEESGWKIAASNIPMSTIEASDICTNIRSSKDNVIFGTLVSDINIDKKLIADSTHVELINTSVKEYAELWKELAER